MCMLPAIEWTPSPGDSEWMMSIISCPQQPCSPSIDSYLWLLLWSQFISFVGFIFSCCLLFFTALLFAKEPCVISHKFNLQIAYLKMMINNLLEEWKPWALSPVVCAHTHIQSVYNFKGLTECLKNHLQSPRSPDDSGLYKNKMYPKGKMVAYFKIIIKSHNLMGVVVVRKKLERQTVISKINPDQ